MRRDKTTLASIIAVSNYSFKGAAKFIHREGANRDRDNTTPSTDVNSRNTLVQENGNVQPEAIGSVIIAIFCGNLPLEMSIFRDDHLTTVAFAFIAKIKQTTSS